ncbi:MAG TPA: hypothetical protein VGF70_05420 [Solirubrobacteraceae bacterium]|jgi:hypothetical protein
MHKRYLTLALCCGAVALAGCGSSSSSNSGTGAATGPANNAVFSADLNALCKQANTAGRKVGNDPAKALALINQFLPKFKALSAAGSQGAIYAKFVASLQKEGADLKANDINAFKADNKSNNTYARQLGAPACA